MKIIYLKRLLFISKSLLWSLLLYITAITIINWEDVLKNVHKDEVAVNYRQSAPNEDKHITNSMPLLALAKGIWFYLSGIENREN